MQSRLIRKVLNIFQQLFLPCYFSTFSIILLSLEARGAPKFSWGDGTSCCIEDAWPRLDEALGSNP